MLGYRKTIVKVGGCCICLVKFRCILFPVENGHNKIQRMKCPSYYLNFISGSKCQFKQQEPPIQIFHNLIVTMRNVI